MPILQHAKGLQPGRLLANGRSGIATPNPFSWALRDPNLARVRRALLADMAEAKSTGRRRFGGHIGASLLTFAMGFRDRERTSREPVLKIFCLLSRLNQTDQADAVVLEMAARIDQLARQAMIFRLGCKVVELPDGSTMLKRDPKTPPPMSEMTWAL